jgi:hypothetical protein
VKACNLKTTLSVRGSKVTMKAFMARGKTTLETWMGILDEVDF